MKSLNEIDTTVKRASRASGFSWGVSEEVGKSIRLLELFGLPGIKNLNQYYQDRETKKFEKLNLIREKNLSSSEPFCPIILGVSFLDQSSDSLSAKGDGGLRQLHQYATLEYVDKIETPPDNYVPDKIGEVSLESLQQQRNKEIPQKMGPPPI